MATRFIGKNIKKKIVRPMKNSVKYQNYQAVVEDKTVKEIEKAQKEVVTETVAEVEVTKKENKKQKKNKEMVSENKLTQIEALAGVETSKTNVKVEKSEKGLFEKTENSTVLLTEDNKMLLND